MSDIATENQAYTADATPSSFEEMLSHLEEEIGYFFRDRRLLRRAMTHRSYANEQADPRPPHNEALEFLEIYDPVAICINLAHHVVELLIARIKAKGASHRGQLFHGDASYTWQRLHPTFQPIK